MNEPDRRYDLHDLILERDQLKKELEEAREVVGFLNSALEKIGKYETIGDEKYCSYEAGWLGVAEYARRAIQNPLVQKVLKASKGGGE